MLFYIPSWASPVIRINIIDAFFCADSLPSSPTIIINKEVLLAKNATKRCDQKDFSMDRYHGRKVLESFIREYKGKRIIEITPIVVFNDAGEHDLVAWQEAFSKKWQEGKSYNLLAIGIPFVKREDFDKSEIGKRISFDVMTYSAKKQSGRHVSASHFVFPSDLELSKVKVISKEHFPDRKAHHELYGNSLSVVLGLVYELNKLN
ncbi:hypothetical protein M899_1690 [Bacteriovorax sp. BSW11_IV]|nr:hypothetical protein M899_1690 [Bacteriovorax sp. BSW11_IV]